MNVEVVKQTFEKRGFSFAYAETAALANAYLKEKTKDKTVTFGGSMTLQEMGTYDALLPSAKEVRWHWKEPGSFAQAPDVYIASANALSETGQIVNIDGAGNRVSATLFGSTLVIFVCGINKLTKDLEAAIWRARNVAAPKNAQRLQKKTPCAAQADRCHSCFEYSEETICRALVVIERKLFGVPEMCVLLVGEELGY